MMEALRKLRIRHSPGAPLFFFTTRDDLWASDPLTHERHDRRRPNRLDREGYLGQWECQTKRTR